jgi:hypothetical protein
MKWMSRLAAILLGVGLIDALVVLLAPRPLPWAAVIPGLIPLLTSVLIIIPMMQEKKT